MENLKGKSLTGRDLSESGHAHASVDGNSGIGRSVSWNEPLTAIADEIEKAVKRPYRRRTRAVFHWVDMDQEWSAGVTRLSNSIGIQNFLMDPRDGEVHVYVVPPVELNAIMTELGDDVQTEYLGDSGTRVIRVIGDDDATAIFVTTPDAIRFSY